MRAKHMLNKETVFICDATKKGWVILTGKTKKSENLIYRSYEVRGNDRLARFVVNPNWRTWRKNVLRELLRIPYRRLKAGFSVCWLCSTVFVSHWESSDWDWMKWTRCERLLLEKPFYLCVSSLVNTFLHAQIYNLFRTSFILLFSQRTICALKVTSLVKEPDIYCRWNLVHWSNKSRRFLKSNKKWGSRSLFWPHNADKYGYLGPFDKNRSQPKTRQKGEISSMMHVVSHRIWL